MKCILVYVCDYFMIVIFLSELFFINKTAFKFKLYVFVRKI